jgi:excisionase family DNA binding protein
MATETLKVKPAADRLGVSSATVYRWVRIGRLASYRLEGRIVVEIAVPDISPDAAPKVLLKTATVKEAVPGSAVGPVPPALSGQRDLVFNWRPYFRSVF